MRLAVLTGVIALFTTLLLVRGEHPRRAIRAVARTADAMPLPFTRELRPSAPAPSGADVFMAQNLLIRSPFVNPNLPLSRHYDSATVAAVSAFKQGHNLPADGVFDSTAASILLQLHLDNDDYKDDGQPLPAGYLYKVYVPLWRNRSIETTAILMDAQLNPLHSFIVRTHGQNDANGDAYNQWSDSGVTPTGLATFDLNSPEDDPVDFGPYPINRFVTGIKGNAAVVISDIRDGILLHTGEWPNWNASMPMPNSHGCIHGHPNDIFMVWQILTTQLGVVVHNNTDGKLPYPWIPQGLVSVELQDP
jgi:peptidoglycan hydrolase-like protein with peptidoglycan-binding domain